MSDDLTRLTDEERFNTAERSVFFKMLADYKRNWIRTDTALVTVESILAARTAALIDRAERAERERDDARQAHAELMQVAGEKYEALRDRARAAAAGLGGKNDRLAAELAALRAAVTGLADEWEAAQGKRVPIDCYGTCDGCAETKQLAWSYPTPDSEPWLCADCDADGRREITQLRALLTDEADTQ